VTESIFHLGLAFFGLSYDIAPKVRESLFTNIHQIVFHGNGGYDWYTVYNMPIWLRKFTFNQIQKHFDEINKTSTNNSTPSGTKTVIDETGKIKAPEFLKSSQTSKRPVKYK
jgi:hypothetical protein